MGCWGNGMIIDSDYGSFPHSLLSTSETKSSWHTRICSELQLAMVACLQHGEVQHGAKGDHIPRPTLRSHPKMAELSPKDGDFR